jgi:methyl-accepting chemotaxis protein
MKLKTKLGSGFTAVILTVLGLGGVSYYMFKQVDLNVTEISQHSLPAVKNATGLERAALETIVEEENYLLDKTDEAQATVRKKLQDLKASLDEMEKVAKNVDDAAPTSKAVEVGKALAEYSQLFDQSVAAMSSNKIDEQRMDEKGAAVEKEANAFMEAKKTEYLEAKDTLAIANNINTLALEIRLNEKAYMLEQKKLYLTAIERNIASLSQSFGQLEKLHPSETEKKQIANARSAIQEYGKAIQAWVDEYQRDAHSTALAEFYKVMNRAGDTLSQILEEYILVKQAAVEKITGAVFIVREVGEASLNTRLNEKAYIISHDKKFWDILNENINRMPALYGALRKAATTTEDAERIDLCVKATEAYLAAAGSWMQNDNQLRRNLLPKMRQNGVMVIKMAQEAENDAWKRSDEAGASARSIVVTSDYVLLVGLLIAILLGSVLAWLITRSITRPIGRIITGLRSGADHAATAAYQVSSSAQQLAEGASEQAAAIEETSSSLEEMSSMTRQNAEHAGQTKQLMAQTKKILTTANQSMERLSASMQNISKASVETQKIIKTIDEIAFQTNLLALNAAVEAARAGEAGAGFAVVADEVRNLAMRAAEAAKNTAQLIEGTVKTVKEGTDLVETTGKEFAQVAASTSQMGDLIGEVAAASQEQALGIEQVNRAVTEMDKVVQRNAANAEESASASEELNAQAQHLRSYVGDLVALVGENAGATRKSLKTTEQQSSSRELGHELKSLPRSMQGNGKAGNEQGAAIAGRAHDAEKPLITGPDSEEIQEF